jgi:hypothetical protein
MKRFFLSGILGLAMAHAAFAQQQSFTWSGTHIFLIPADPPPTIDAYNFTTTPGATFGVDSSAEILFEFANAAYFTTSDTLNITNRGKLVGVPGFDFGYYPNPPQQPRPGVPFNNLGGTFANIANGLGGGSIYCTNIYGGLSPFNTFNPFNIFFGFVFGSGSTGVLPEAIPGLAEVKIRATNVIDSGLISMDNTGLIDIKGGDVDLRRGQFVMANSSLLGSSAGITPLDWGSGLFGNTNLFGWNPSQQLTATTAQTPFFLSSVSGAFEQMNLTNATVYIQGNLVGTNRIVWHGVYLQDFSSSNVVKNVYFGADPDFTNFGFGAIHIEWAASYRDPISDGVATNYFYLSDYPDLRRITNSFFPNPPNNFTFFETGTKHQFNNPPATPGYFNPAPQNTIVTNDFSYISVHPNAAQVDTNVIFGGSVTNLPGRIQITASHTLNLADTHISGLNYLLLASTNDFLGNSNALIASPYTDLNLGVRSGFLTLSNLLESDLIQWTGVPGAPSAVTFAFGPATPMGGVQAWSGSYIFVDANGFTNDVRMLLVNSALQPTTPALQQNVTLHAANTLTVSDSLTIFHSFFSDATTLTLTTNGNSGFALAGQINFTSPDIFWSTALPNLQYLTNSGFISTENQAVFAGNLINPYSDPDSATPYQSFVNYGNITNQGTFIRTGWFQNNGVISENNGGSIDIQAATAIATNSSFIAPLGNVSVVANSLLASNGIIQAGGTLAFSTPCFLSDGYVFENQFGHITNSVLPYVVTNGNIWTVNGGIQIGVKPATGDLLGTTITNFTAGGLNAGILWPGEDRGISQGGYATNLALGRMILNADSNSASEFTFQTQNGNNAIYIDSLELQGNTTNTDAHGDPLSIAIQPGMTVYYAQATENGVSIAEKLNGKFGAGYINGGRFYWVSNYAGVYSSTNIPYPDGNTYIFNQALAISPDIDSDGDGTVNGSDATPISIGTTFDISNIGPLSCDGGNDGGITGNGGLGGGGSGTTSGASSAPGTLSFPNPSSGSSTISFALAQGSYNGLFYDTNGVNPASSGFFTAKVTAKRGLSAKLQLGGHTYSFSKPPFDTSGHFSGQVSSKGAATLSVDLQLVNNDEIVGQVSGNGWTANLVAERAAFGSKNKAPWAGSDTLLLSTKTNSTTAAGDSFASVSISSSGAVQLSGVLPDGTKISQKSALSKDGLWPLYAAPYGGAGAFIGWMQCTNNSDITGSGVWVVPAGLNTLYPGGLTNDLDATGSSAAGSVKSSIKAILDGPSLDSSLTNHVTIIGKTGQSADGSLKLSINLKTGLFTGSLADPNGSEALSLQGAFLEGSESSGGGFFLSADKKQGGKITLVPAN